MIETLKSGTMAILEAGSYNPNDVIEGVAEIGMRVVIGRRVFDQVIMGHSALVHDTDECLRLKMPSSGNTKVVLRMGGSSHMSVLLVLAAVQRGFSLNSRKWQIGMELC